MDTQFFQGAEALLTWCYINRVHFVVEMCLQEPVQSFLLEISLSYDQFLC